jgi:hypothetical protein
MAHGVQTTIRATVAPAPFAPAVRDRFASHSAPAEDQLLGLMSNSQGDV